MISLYLFKNIKNVYKFSSCNLSQLQDHNPKIRKKLSEILDLKGTRLSKVIQKHPLLNSIEVPILEKAESVLNAFNIDVDQLRESPQVLTVFPTVIEQRAMVLQELGVQEITAKNIVRYLNLVKRKINLLKSYRVLPMDLNLTQQLYSYLEPPPKHAGPIPKITDERTLIEAFTLIRQHYVVWKLEFPDPEQYLHVVRTYLRLKHKSLRSMRETLELLEKDIGFTKERIRMHGYLIHSHPENTRDILSKIPYLGGLPIREVLIKIPKIVMTNVDTLLETNQILRDNGINDEAIRNCFNIFTLSSESVLLRLQENKEIPEFNALSTNTRVLNLVNNQSKAKLRLNHLRELKMRNASLHVLSASNATFNKYVSEGADKTRGDDIINYLQQNLKTNDCNYLRDELIKHPFWFHVPLIQVCESYNFLSKKYKPEDIKQVLQILLYPKSKVETEIQLIRKQSELDRKWLSPVQELNLCLYLIEKPHHFTGDGIWLTDTEK